VRKEAAIRTGLERAEALPASSHREMVGITRSGFGPAHPPRLRRGCGGFVGGVIPTDAIIRFSYPQAIRSLP
jgi:hypothetical protein